MGPPRAAARLAVAPPARRGDADDRPPRPVRRRDDRRGMAAGRLRAEAAPRPRTGGRVRDRRPGGGRPLRPGARRRPQDRVVQAHEGRGASARPARRLPARRRRGRLRRTRHRVGRRRPAPAGQGGQRRDDGPGPGPARRRRGARVGPGPARPDRRRDVGRRLRRHARVALRAVPAQGVLSRTVARGGSCDRTDRGAAGVRSTWPGRSGRSSVPTPEQAAVIEAPLRPLLVVAGAGSGKTETMAARVVWLVANDLVRPDEVLGLTFTRKAAGELSERVVARLGALRRCRPVGPVRGRRRRGPRRRPHGLDVPRVRGPDRPRARGCVWASRPRAGCSPRPPPGRWRTRPSRPGTGRWRGSRRPSPP